MERALPHSQPRTASECHEQNNPPLVKRASIEYWMRRTSNLDLQKKLESLAALAAAGDREAFARAFVPLDLTEEDFAGYLGDLQNDENWRNVVAEIAALVSGESVTSISGDQVRSATFVFPHPLQPMCDREVVFICSAGEWRADG
jgi:hypothetical protein